MFHQKAQDYWKTVLVKLHQQKLGLSSLGLSPEISIQGK